MMNPGAQMGGSGGVLHANATEEKGEHARLSSFVGALAITDMLSTTLVRYFFPLPLFLLSAPVNCCLP